MVPATVRDQIPIFRSNGQARLLARLFLRPDEGVSLRALARELDLDASVVSREAARLEEAGIISSKNVGRSRVIAPNPESLYYPELSSLVLKAFGPMAVLRELVRNLEGVDDAYIYGSWAERYLGESHSLPNDIDLLIVGKPNRRELSKRTRQADSQLGLEVNATVVPPDEWFGERSGFIRSIKRKPLIPLLEEHDGAR
jgi:predicted nucleotidyltransferase